MTTGVFAETLLSISACATNTPPSHLRKDRRCLTRPPASLDSSTSLHRKPPRTIGARAWASPIRRVQTAAHPSAPAQVLPTMSYSITSESYPCRHSYRLRSTARRPETTFVRRRFLQAAAFPRVQEASELSQLSPLNGPRQQPSFPWIRNCRSRSTGL